MQARISPKESNKFKPFSLTIDFKNKNDARLMWHRLNASPSEIREYESHNCDDFGDSNSEQVWNTLNSHMQKHGLLK